MHPESHAASDKRRVQALAKLRSVLRERANSFVATLAHLEGSAVIHDRDLNRTRPVESGVRLSRNNRLEVRSGRALVRMSDGSDLWVAKGGMIDFSGWSEKKRGMGLLAGRVLVIVSPDKDHPFVATTPGGEIEVTGTAFEATTLNGALSVCVFHGSVNLKTARHAPVRARAGSIANTQGSAAPSVRRFASGDRKEWGWLAGLQSQESAAKVGAAYTAVIDHIPADRPKPKAASVVPGEKESQMNRSSFFKAGLALLVIGLSVWGIRAMIQKDKPRIELKTIVPEKVEPFVAADGKEMEKVTIRSPHPEGETGETQTFVVPKGGKIQVGVLKRDGKSGGAEDLRTRYDELIKGGMTPEQANEVLSKSLSDSISKQLNAETKGEPGNKEVNIRLKFNEKSPGEGAK